MKIKTKMCSVNNSKATSSSSVGVRSHSAQGLANSAVSSPYIKIPLPPRLWITDVSDESSDEFSGTRDDGAVSVERVRVRSRFRHHKQRSLLTVPIGIFWDIENCQVPRGCSALNVVAAIRAKFLTGRREADFVVVCDVRKESAMRLQELNDAQVSLIHVCGTQKNAADEKLRQCIRRFGELHTAPAALLLISGDINFAADLSDFRHRKNMEVILVHKQNTSSALIACASSHYSYDELTAHLPRNPKISHTEEELPTCEIEVNNLPKDQTVDRVTKRLKRLADNCGGKVLNVNAPTALLRFPTPIQAARALKRMNGEDVFGRKISTRYARNMFPTISTYSSDEGYSTAVPAVQPLRPTSAAAVQPLRPTSAAGHAARSVPHEWALALQQLPAPTPPPLDFCPPPAPKPRKIRGTHGSANLDRSGCSSSNSGDDMRQRDHSASRAMSPWNSSASFSEQSDGEIESTAELTVSNLPPYENTVLQAMVMQLFNQYVPVVRVSVWSGGEGPLATVVLRSEWDARLAIARIHKKRLGNQWTERRLELSLGKPSPAPNLDVLKARMRAILLHQTGYVLPLLRLRDAYASRYCCALTTSDIMKIRDTVIVHEGLGRMVQLIDLTPVTSAEMDEAPWKCPIHAGAIPNNEDGSRILQPVLIEMDTLGKNTKALLESHGGILPLLSFVECYESSFPALCVDGRGGVPLELLLRNVPGVEVRDSPSRHLAWIHDVVDAGAARALAMHNDSLRSSGERERARTSPVLEPMLALFERELVDLLRTAPRCTIPFSKLIPAFHHYFGRQCRVADYGFTKLPDLLSVLSNTIVILGSGSSRMITLSSSAQNKRWTTDLVKLMKAQPGRTLAPHDIPRLYQAMYGRPFSPVDYGVCTFPELMKRVNGQAVIVSPNGTVSLPRRDPTPEEYNRTIQFAAQAAELLCYTPNLRMEFSRFVPAYHAHFDRQLRVAHYGCVKLVELFELIPDAVTVYPEADGERGVKLSQKTAVVVMGQRLRALGPCALSCFPTMYAGQFGSPPLPDILNTSTLSELIFAAGGSIENGVVFPPSKGQQPPAWVSSALSACAVLTADRSINIRGSTLDYFVTAFRRLCTSEPDIENLVLNGVIVVCDKHVRLTPVWRSVWRVVQICSEYSNPLTAVEIFTEYNKRYEPMFSCIDLGIDSVSDFLRDHGCVFSNCDGGVIGAGGGAGRWRVRAGVTVPRVTEPQPAAPDYSVHDTPPGQKGSRVFESPISNIWSSPPASALPAPTALLPQEKRRTRLAAQFDAA